MSSLKSTGWASPGERVGPTIRVESWKEWALRFLLVRRGSKQGRQQGPAGLGGEVRRPESLWKEISFTVKPDLWLGH